MDIWFTARAGGVSTGRWSSLNLGSLVGDDPGAVSENWERAAAAGGLSKGDLARVRQVHGCRVVTAGDGFSGGADAIVLPRGRGGACILTADCVPVIIAGADAAAVVHAGWRGLVAGVIDAAVRALPDPYVAWIGPAIRSCCYEVGPDVTGAFQDAGLPVAGVRRVDPPEAAASALGRAGIESIADCGICTSCNEGYYSHRRATSSDRLGDRDGFDGDGITGRQGAFVRWI